MKWLEELAYWLEFRVGEFLTRHYELITIVLLTLILLVLL